MLKLKNDIFIAGLPRSAGTLIANIMQTLFNKNKITHMHHFEYSKENNFVIIVYRDVRDCIVSSYRVRKQFNNLKDIKKASIFQLYGHIAAYEQLISNNFNIKNYKIQNKKKILLLKYEDFFENFNYLFQRIENFFNIKIEEKNKIFIKENYSLMNKKKYLDKFQNFIHKDEGDFHGHHIFTGQPETWKLIVKEKHHEYYNYYTSKANFILEYKNKNKIKPNIIIFFICLIYKFFFKLDNFLHRVRRRIYTRNYD